jgi:50S ribosomal subunit-associated GTPase HflX
LLDTSARERLLAQYPRGVLMSAREGSGARELVDVLASRLALEADLHRLEFDTRREADRRLIAELYRHARVVSHVTTEHRAVVDAEIPRRLLDRFTRAKVPA